MFPQQFCRRSLKHITQQAVNAFNFTTCRSHHRFSQLPHVQRNKEIWGIYDAKQNKTADYSVASQVEHKRFASTETKKDKGKLIYQGPMTKLVRGVKMFSLSTSVVALGMQPIMWSLVKELNTALLVGGGMYNFLFMSTPLLIHWAVKGYVSELHYNPDSKVFTLTKFTFFLRRKSVEFTRDDFKVPDVSGVFTTAKIHGKSMFLVTEPDMFEDIDAFEYLMRIDKPFHLDMDKVKKIHKDIDEDRKKWDAEHR